MPDPTRSSIRFRAAGLLSLLGFAVLWSCGREVVGPGGALVRYVRGLSFNAVFPTAYQQAAGAELVSFTKVRVVLHHSDGSVALDTVVDFPSTATELPLTLSVPLLANAPAGGEVMSLNLAYINAAGDTVFKGGPVAITAVPTGVGGTSNPPPPVIVPVAYTGPGANATAVRIAAPKTRALNIGDAFAFTANAVDGSGNPIPGTPIIWVSADPSVATMSPAGAGSAVARGTARIVAQLLTGQTDTASVTVTALPQSIGAQSGGGQSAVINATLTAPLVARVLGTDNLPLGGVAVSFAVTAGGGSVGTASATSDANGLAQTTWKLGATVGAQSVTASVAGIATPATFAATATLPVPSRLAFTTQPVTGLTGAVVVQAQDNIGNLATSFTGPVTIALGGGTASATLGGTATVNAVAGVATFTGLSVSAPGSGYSLTATASGLASATSNAFDVTAGPATTLMFTQSPAGGSIDAVLSPAPVVTVQDAHGNIATSFTGVITLALSGGGTLRGPTSVAAVAGVATFPGLAISVAGKGFTLTASAPGLTSGISAAFDMSVGAPAALTIVSGSGQTGATGAALAQPVIVRVTDVAGEPVPHETVTFTAANSGSASPGTTTTDTLGRAQSTWTLGAATGAQSLTISGPRLTAFAKTATATAVIVASTPTQLVVTTQPGATYTAGASIAPAITVEAHDASNLLVPSFTGAVSLAIGANPGTSTLTGTATVNAVAGVATFSGLSLNKSGTGYTLVASSSGLTSATTTAFAITAGAATSIVITAGNFQSAAVSTVLPNPVVVQTVDAIGNGVAGKTVNFAVATGGGSVSPASATTNATGNAQTTWTLGASVSPQTLTITSAGLTGSPLTATANSGAATVASTVVTPHLDTLTAIGATFGLAAQAKDAGSANVAGTFVWVSRTPAVATVNASGTVTAVTNGTTWVVATESGGTKDSALIVVQQRLATINVTPNPRNIYLGASFAFAASAVDGLGVSLTTQPAFTWSSASSAIASVTSGGVATGVGLGATQVRATSGAVTGVATLNVLTPITRITVSRDSAGFSVATSDTFTVAAFARSRSYRATAYDTLNSVMTGVTFTFVSSNASVAAIDSTGTSTVRATAVANGSTSISAQAQGVTGAALLKVKQVLTSIDLSPAAVTIAPTGSTALLARGKDANGFFIPGGAFTFASSATSLATVTATTGVVTGVANGTALITAKDSATGTITSNVSTITVGGAVPAIISFGRDTLTVGRSGSASVPIYLSKPSLNPITINLAVRDTFAVFATSSIVIPAGSTSGNATLNGHNAGTTLIYASDGSALGYTADTAVLAVQATVKLTTTNYYLNVNDQLSTQVLLTDPSPAGGTYVTFGYGTAGRAAVSPDPAFIPAGQLAANVVILATGAGSTTITPAATGVNGTASTVTTSAPVLTIQPSSLRLGAGQFEYNEYVWVPQYLYAPLSVTLTSADTSKVTVPSPLTMTTGTNYAYFNTTGKAPGLVTVTASATNWTTGTMSVLVTSPKLGISGGTTLNTTSPAQNVWVYAQDSLSTTHYRTSSLAVQVTSSDTTVLKVLNPSVSIPAGQYYVNTAQVTPGGAGGTAWLKATASGHGSDSTQYTVVGPKLNFGWYSNRVGAGQDDYNLYVYTPNNVTSTLTVTIANADSTIVGLPTSVTIPAGTNLVYFNIRGKSVGFDTFIASAQGYQPDTAFYTVTSPRLALSGGGTLNNFGANSGFTVYAADSLRSAHYRDSLLVVTYTSTNPAVFTVTNSTDTVQAGLYYANHVQVTPTGVGTAKLVASAAGHLPDTVSYIVQTPQLGVSFARAIIGRRQYAPSGAYVYIPNGRPTSVTATVTRAHPTVDSLTATTLVIPANTNYLYFDYAGLTVGSDTLTITAPGYLSTSAVITVTTPKLTTGGLPSTALTTSTPSTVTVYATDSLGTAHYVLDTIVVSAVSSNGAVIQPTAPSTRIYRGSYYVQPAVAYTGPGTASMTYSDSLGTGYGSVTTNTVTVTGPSLSISNGTAMLGMRQNGGPNSAYVYVANAVTGSPLVVTLTSSDPTVVSVPATVTIPVGNSYAYFQITAQNVIGTIQITATASGYGGANTTVQVTAPKFALSTSASVNTTSPRQTITLYAQDANGTAHYVNQNLAVALASSSTAVGTVDSVFVTIPAGAYYNNNAKFIPLTAGTTQLSATDTTSASYRYAAATQNVAVNTPSLSLSWGVSESLGIGQYDDRYAQTPDYQLSPLTVSFAHFNAASTTASSVVIGAGTYYSTLRVTGASTGADTITATASGHNPAKGAVVVGPGRIDQIAGWPSTLSLAGTDSVLVTMYARDQNNSTTHYVSAATTFTLTASANVGFVSGGVSSAPITTVTIPANAYYVQFWVKGLTAGTSAVTIANANYVTYSPTITVTP